VPGTWASSRSRDQYLAYVHNAIDQLRGEAGSLQFFSNGQFRNPMVVRIAGLAYQKGFGGHFHNDSRCVARDIRGSQSRARRMAATRSGSCAPVAAAHVDGAVVVFLEPIALYMTEGSARGRTGSGRSAPRARLDQESGARTRGATAPISRS
jgi:2-oxoisovalerate dehydrogenase E1 component